LTAVGAKTNTADRPGLAQWPEAGNVYYRR